MAKRLRHTFKWIAIGGDLRETWIKASTNFLAAKPTAVRLHLVKLGLRHIQERVEVGRCAAQVLRVQHRVAVGIEHSH